MKIFLTEKYHSDKNPVFRSLKTFPDATTDLTVIPRSLSTSSVSLVELKITKFGQRIKA